MKAVQWVATAMLASAVFSSIPNHAQAQMVIIKGVQYVYRWVNGAKVLVPLAAGAGLGIAVERAHAGEQQKGEMARFKETAEMLRSLKRRCTGGSEEAACEIWGVQPKQ